jgi:Ni/Co efflux regulator RcnB
MKRLLTAALALSLLGGTAALAQPYDQRQGDHSGYDQQRRDQQHNGQAGYGQRNDQGGYGQRSDRQDQRQMRHWARGQRLPPAYYQDRGHYVDYRSHHLRRPPRGYQWVQADNNYALVALTTGLIASIVAANNY